MIAKHCKDCTSPYVVFSMAAELTDPQVLTIQTDTLIMFPKTDKAAVEALGYYVQQLPMHNEEREKLVLWHQQLVRYWEDIEKKKPWEDTHE